MVSSGISQILIIVCVVLSAYFSATETAFNSVNRIRLKSLAEKGDEKAALVLKLLEEYDKLLTTILIGNNLVNIAATALATVLFVRLLGEDRGTGIATLVITLVLLVFGEVTPKTMASREADSMALRFAPVIRLLMILFTPLVAVVNHLAALALRILGAGGERPTDVMTEEELRTIVQVGHEEGVIETGEREMIDNVFDLGETEVRDIMVPRIDMTWVEEDADMETVLGIFRRDKYTRIPVCRETADTVVGILNVKDLILRDPDKEFHIRDLMREPLFTYEQKKTSELMREMSRKCSSIAIVLDEYGVTAGLITLEDILEEIVGEIRDEYDSDEEKDIVRTGQGEYLVSAAIRLTDLNDALGLELASENYESLGGFVMEHLDHLPEPGETLETAGLHFTVEKMERQRIDKIRIKLG